eukprot:CAMPEP_0204459822 /NCGR_PEP_ID=MMETSP0471-20130131/4407_2 /ASSEMBLY_ACC=CAM_ASM_000602 /TAXON_ID=2969 /ORGANISM="Oxyrrhis marina" /LENGTH=113 /DNA_ID=CAMNT_0051460653 /DNA_START=389 /DNA_END=726 /DNA_ORIENTATION=-
MGPETVHSCWSTFTFEKFSALARLVQLAPAEVVQSVRADAHASVWADLARQEVLAHHSFTLLSTAAILGAMGILACASEHTVASLEILAVNPLARLYVSTIHLTSSKTHRLLA